MLGLGFWAPSAGAFWLGLGPLLSPVQDEDGGKLVIIMSHRPAGSDVAKGSQQPCQIPDTEPSDGWTCKQEDRAGATVIRTGPRGCRSAGRRPLPDRMELRPLLWPGLGGRLLTAV